MHKLLVASLALSLAACSDRTPQVVTLQQPAPVVQPGVMTVTGTATLDVSPDCADLTVTLIADASKAATASSALTKKQTELVTAMKELGVEGRDIKLSSVMLNPNYRGLAAVVVGYRAQVTLTLTTKRFENIAPMMEAGARAGALTMSTQFRRSDISELKKKVREMALKAAKEKAQLTASALDISLGRVTSVGEVPAGAMWTSAYFPNYIANEAAQAALLTQTIGGATQTLTLDVTVGFELGNKA